MGKRGGVRVVYFNRLDNGEIWLPVIYAKAVRGNIPAHLLKAIKSMAKSSMTGEEFGQKLLESVHQMKAGQAARVTHVEIPPLVEVRNRIGLSQAQFAALLGVSVRTLQEWEQGRRQPSGAAKMLLRVAERYPEVLRELAEG
ncbi:helix-turn-helix domain-containing protein [Nitrosococcus wardiae]